MNESWRLHWKNYADAFGYPLKANELLGKFTSNTEVTGAYAEAWIKTIVKSMLPQFKISTGIIIRASDQNRDLQKIPQLDLIIWDPSKLPAIFELGDFALVPNFSALAVIEVKRTCTNIRALQEQLQKQQKCLLHEFRPNTLAVVISHPSPLFDGEVKPDWLKHKTSNTPSITRLLDSDNNVDADGLFVLIYFLAQIAGHGWI